MCAFIGTPEAFRGLPFQPTVVAREPREWAEGAQAVFDGAHAGEPEATRTVEALHADRRPWDELHDALRNLAPTRGGR